MEGGVATAMDSRPYAMDNDDDIISYDSDSSGDSKLRKIMEQKFLTEHGTTPRRPSESHRDAAPPAMESPKAGRRNSNKERRRPRLTSLQSYSPIPSWYYNPYSQRDYSPSVSSVTPRKALSSWMDAMMRTPNERDLQDDEDDLSIDSVEQLEQAAAQIRSEIRQLEMKELADEAENAAEAGYESFAGRASTFGDSSLSSFGDVDVSVLKPGKLKRYSTYSEGTSLLKQVRPVRTRPKIRCLQLRDINEVIPPIGELHSNLRTHLMLSGVERQSLEPSTDAQEQAAERAKAVKSPVEFLSSLKSWVSTSPSSEPWSPSSTDVASNITTPRQSTVNKSNKQENVGDDGECSVATFASMDPYEVGGRLSEHIHSPKAVHRSPIRIPMGLDLPDDLGIPHELPSKLLLLNEVDRTDVDTVETVPTSSSSQQDDSNQDNRGSPRHDLEDLTPIALFEQIEGDDDSVGDGADSVRTGSSSNSMHSAGTRSSSNSMLATSPTNQMGNTFVTPMRLRGIRKASKRLAMDRSLQHKSADLGWTLKVVKLRQTMSDPPSLAQDDDPLNIPVLSVMSEDRDVVLRDNSSVAAPLNRSKDVSVSSLPKDIASNSHGPIFPSLSGPPLDGGHQEVLQEQESRESMISALEPPLSLSFDEHNVSGVVEDLASNLTKGHNDETPLTDDNSFVTNEHKLNNAVLDEHVADQGAMKTKHSRDLSLTVAPSDEIDLAKAASLVAIEVVDADGDVVDFGDEVNVSHARSTTPEPIQSLTCDESLPLMPLLDKNDELRHAEESDGTALGTDQEDPRSLSQVVVPRIEKRPSCAESVPTIPAIEISNDSMLSLNLENIFEIEEPCAVKEGVNVDIPRVVTTGDANDGTHIEADTEPTSSLPDLDADKAKAQNQLVAREESDSSDPILESRSMEQSDGETTGGHSESDPISEFYESLLPFDEKEEDVASGASKDESEKDKHGSDDGVDIDKSCDGPILPTGASSATPPKALVLEVRDMNDASGDIVHHEERNENYTPGYSKREEIYRSPSGRVRVTMIEHSLHDDDTDDDGDDDVRSEADSALSPQPHPCECLINVATQFEENVGADLAKTTQAVQARYHLCMPNLDHSEQSASNVSVTTNISPTNAPLEEMHPQPSLPESAIELKRSPPRRTLSCPNFIALKEVDTSIESFNTIPHKSLPAATTASERGLYEINRGQLIHARSMLDPCQSASPFRETMDDMMQNFSPKRSFETERIREKILAKENHDFLNNYLYCSKPSGQPVPEYGPNMCGEQCSDFMSGVLDRYRSIVPKRSTSGRDMLSLNAGDDTSYPSATTETWFDVASEHFDVALERVMGSADAQRRRWNSMFQAPSLKSKKENGQSKAPPNKDVKGILLVKQSNTMDSQDELSEQQFGLMYGMKREELVQLSVTERSVLHDKAHEIRRRWMSHPTSQGTGPGRPPPSPAVSSVRSLSSSDLPKMEELI